MTHYVYSTLTADQDYAIYPNDMDPKSIPGIDESVFIAGQCNVADRKTLLTPKGMMTKVTDEQLAILKKIPAFKEHQRLGFITVESKKADPEKVARDMTEKDTSAQLVDEDFDPDRQPQVNIGG